MTGQKANVKALDVFEKLQSLLADLESSGAYLTVAESILPTDHVWRPKAQSVQGAIVGLLQSPKSRGTQQTRQVAIQELATLKKSYAEAYLALHGRARLGAKDDRKKAKLTQDQRLVTLKSLATIDLMPAGQLVALQQRLVGLSTFFALTEGDLQPPTT